MRRNLIEKETINTDRREPHQVKIHKCKALVSAIISKMKLMVFGALVAACLAVVFGNGKIHSDRISSFLRKVLNTNWPFLIGSGHFLAEGL